MAKRYIIKCLACRKLDEVSRSDAIYCSSSCRVWAKRHPEEIAERVRLHKMMEVPTTMQVQLEAYFDLFSDRMDAIRDGTLPLDHPTRKDVIADDAAEEAAVAFWKVVAEAVELTSAPGA